MRIRKAEKLLIGFASMPCDSAADIVSAAVLLCEINRVSINLRSSNHQKEGIEIGSDAKEERDEVNEKGSARKRREKEGEAVADGLMNGAGEEEDEGVNLCNFSCRKKMKTLKKRGRKPMKARSLKSLLSFQVC